LSRVSTAESIASRFGGRVSVDPLASQIGILIPDELIIVILLRYAVAAEFKTIA
jgi:hypothetical protein